MAVIEYRDKDGNFKRLSTILAGKDGKDAYKLAVEKGFNGTEEEWLENLKCHPDQVIKVGDSSAMPSIDSDFQLFIDETEEDEEDLTLEDLGINLDKSEEFQHEKSRIDILDNKRTEWKNVKKYGVVGDGVADDTAEIQALLDKASPGDVIYFPVGNYKISSGLTINQKMITLRGDNPGNWGFTWHNWNAGTTQKVASVITLASGVTDVTMLTIKGASTNSDVVIDSLKFEGGAYRWTEIAIGDFEDVTQPRDVYNVEVLKENVNGIYCDTTTLKFSQLSLINVTCSGFSGTAVKLGNCGRTVNYACMYSNIAMETGIDNVINHAYITMCNSGIKIGANNALIYNTWIDLIRTYGVFSDNYVSGNFVMNLDHIGYSGFHVKGLRHANMMVRINRCGGYYFGCDESLITDYEKAAQIYAEVGQYNVINMTVDTSKSWSDSTAYEGKLLSTPYNLAGISWDHNNVNLGMQGHYGIFKKVSYDPAYKIYFWNTNTFTVAGKHYEMGSNGLLNVATSDYLPVVTDTFTALGGKLNYKPLAYSLPSSASFTFPTAKTYIKVYGSDNKWFNDTFAIPETTESTENGTMTITYTDDCKIALKGSLSATTTIYIYGGAESSDADVTLEKDIYIRAACTYYNCTMYLSTSEGSISLSEEEKKIDAGTVIYGIYISAKNGTYTTTHFILNANYGKKLFSVNGSLTLSDNTNYTMVDGSKVTIDENKKWCVDGNILSNSNQNEFNEFFYDLFRADIPVITNYWGNTKPFEISYTTTENERRLNEMLDSVLYGE